MRSTGMLGGVVRLVWLASYELICPDTVWEGEPVSTWATQHNAKLALLLLLLLGTTTALATSGRNYYSCYYC